MLIVLVSKREYVPCPQCQELKLRHPQGSFPDLASAGDRARIKSVGTEAKRG